jgi:hypothetical protein
MELSKVGDVVLVDYLQLVSLLGINQLFEPVEIVVQNIELGLGLIFSQVEDIDSCEHILERGRVLVFFVGDVGDVTLFVGD